MSDDVIQSTLEGGLAQYGVLGMKWGRRRPRGSDGKVVKGPTSDDYKTSRANMKRRRESLSTAEIQALNNRLQAERTNKDLQSAGALRKIRAGTAAVGTILAVATTAQTVINIANGPIGKIIRDAIAKPDPNRLF